MDRTTSDRSNRASTILGDDIKISGKTVIRAGYRSNVTVASALVYQTTTPEQQIEPKHLEEPAKPATQQSLLGDAPLSSDGAAPRTPQSPASNSHEADSGQHIAANKETRAAPNSVRQSPQEHPVPESPAVADHSLASARNFMNTSLESASVVRLKLGHSKSQLHTALPEPEPTLSRSAPTSQSSVARIDPETSVKNSAEPSSTPHETPKNTRNPDTQRRTSGNTVNPQVISVPTQPQMDQASAFVSKRTAVTAQPRVLPGDQTDQEHIDTPENQKHTIELAPTSQSNPNKVAPKIGKVVAVSSGQAGMVMQPNKAAAGGALETALLESKAFDDMTPGQLSDQHRIANIAVTPVITKADLPSHIPRQLAEVLNTSSGKSVEVALRPEELGRVKMSITQAENGVIVNILAERPDTLDLLRRHIDQLNHELKLLGYQSPQFSFQNEGESPSPDQNDTPHERASLSNDAATSPALPSTEERRSVQPQSGLDIRI